MVSIAASQAAVPVSLPGQCIVLGFPGGSDGKEFACSEGDPGLISGSGRSLGGGNGIPLQYSCQGNPLNRGSWWATVHGVAYSQTRLSDFHL